jgi:hypothetical protein
MPKRKGDRQKMFRDFSMMKTEGLKANYLKNFDLVIKNTVKTQPITYSEMMFMIFIYDYEFFTIEHIVNVYKRSYMKLEIRLLYPLLKKGYIYKHFDKLSPSQSYEDHLFREETKYNYRVRYALSQKGRMAVAKFYRKMEGDEPID